MTIVVASMAVIVLAGVSVLCFAFALHFATQSPRFRAWARGRIFSAAAQFYVVRRATRHRLEPVIAKFAARIRSRTTPAPEVEQVPAQSGQQ